MINKRYFAIGVLAASVVMGGTSAMAAGGSTEPSARSWANSLATTNAMLSFDYARFAQPVDDCFETMIGEALTNVVVGTNIAQVWIGFDGVAGTCYTLEYFDNESRAWFSSGALLSTSTNGFYKMWDDVNVGNPHRLYRVVGCLNEFVWVDDQSNLPGNAVFAGEFENWNWVSGNPSAFSGTEAHQSTNAGGMHQHYFHSTTDRLSIQPGDVMFCYVYLNPSSVPATVMLQWADDISGWVHRAYWGANNLAWGVDGTGSRRRMGDLPPAGQWVRLEVPANLVDLVGRSVHGMAFTLWDGQATWDDAGKKAGAIPSDALAAGD